jgi:hypothetical protein
LLPLVASAQQTVSVALQNPLGVGSFCALLKAILNVIMALGVPVMVLFMVMAGARFVFARGNTEALVKARKNLLYTIAGIGLFLGVWVLAAVVSGIINSLQSSSGNQTTQINSC